MTKRNTMNNSLSIWFLQYPIVPWCHIPVHLLPRETSWYCHAIRCFFSFIARPNRKKTQLLAVSQVHLPHGSLWRCRITHAVDCSPPVPKCICPSRPCPSAQKDGHKTDILCRLSPRSAYLMAVESHVINWLRNINQTLPQEHTSLSAVGLPPNDVPSGFKPLTAPMWPLTSVRILNPYKIRTSGERKGVSHCLGVLEEKLRDRCEWLRERVV